MMIPRYSILGCAGLALAAAKQISAGQDWRAKRHLRAGRSANWRIGCLSRSRAMSRRSAGIGWCEMAINPAWAEHADRDVVIAISQPRWKLASLFFNCNSFSFAIERFSQTVFRPDFVGRSPRQFIVA